MLRNSITSLKRHATISIVRHFETTFNIAERIQGQSSRADIQPTLHGLQEAKEKLSTLCKPNLLITSSLRRTQHTAEAWYGVPYEKITTTKIIDAGLNEVNAGRLEGLYMNNIPPEFKNTWELWKKQPQHFTQFPDGESMIEFQSRVLTSFANIAKRFGDDSEKNIVIITHGGPMRILRCYLDNKDISHFANIKVHNVEHWQLSDNDLIRLQKFNPDELSEKPSSTIRSSI